MVAVPENMCPGPTEVHPSISAAAVAVGYRCAEYQICKRVSNKYSHLDAGQYSSRIHINPVRWITLVVEVSSPEREGERVRKGGREFCRNRSPVLIMGIIGAILQVTQSLRLREMDMDLSQPWRFPPASLLIVRKHSSSPKHSGFSFLTPINGSALLPPSYLRDNLNIIANYMEIECSVNQMCFIKLNLYDLGFLARPCLGCWAVCPARFRT